MKTYDYVNPEHYKSGSKEVYEMMIDTVIRKNYKDTL